MGFGLLPLLVWTATKETKGTLRVRIVRGEKLARRDRQSLSDPYVVVTVGKQVKKTRVIKDDQCPKWNEDLTFSVTDSNLLGKLEVFDWDFLRDDKMGDAEFEIQPLVEAARMWLKGIPSGTILGKVERTRTNCLTEASQITYLDGKVVQQMLLRLRNVECGEIELQLQWIPVP